MDALRLVVKQVQEMEAHILEQDARLIEQTDKINEQAETIEKQAGIIQRQAAIVAEQDQIIELYGKLADRIDDYRARRQAEPFPFPPNAPAPAEAEPDEKPASNFAKRYTDEIVAEWYRLAQSGATNQEIANQFDTTSTTVRKRLSKFKPPEQEQEQGPQPDPIVAAIDAYGKPEQSPEGMSLQERVDRWEAALHRNLTVPEIAKNFHVSPKAVEEALQARGLICECGMVIGRENPGILRGHDGVCGYCLQDRIGVKSASGII